MSRFVLVVVDRSWNVTLSTFKIIKFIIAFAIVHLFDLTTSSKPYQCRNICMCLCASILSEQHLMIHQNFFFLTVVFLTVRFAHFFLFRLKLILMNNIRLYVYVVWNKRQTKWRKQKICVMKFFSLHVVATWPLIQNKRPELRHYYSTEK